MANTIKLFIEIETRGYSIRILFTILVYEIMLQTI